MELNHFVENYIKENHPETSDRVQNEIANAIRAGYYFSKGKSIDYEYENGTGEINSENIHLLNHIYGKAKQIWESKELDEEQKYDLIFSDRISMRVNHLFRYADPDTSYEEDTAAFMNAFREYVEEENRLSKYKS